MFSGSLKLNKLFSETLKSHPKVLLLYLDLKCPDLKNKSYNGDEKQRDQDSYKMLNQARSAFLKPRKHHPLFHGLIGYAWKYRYSHGQGLICSMVLLYDATLETQLYSLTHALGSHWQSVAPQGSRYWSPVKSHSTVSDDQYFGLLEANDNSVIEGLLSLSRLMTLYDVYIRPMPPKKMHVFDSSEPPKNSGRRHNKVKTTKKIKKREHSAPIVEARKKRQTI